MCQSACHRYWPKFPSYLGLSPLCFSPLFMLPFFDFDQDEFFGRLCQGLHIQIRFGHGWWEKNCWNVKIAPFLLKVIEPLMFTLMYLLIFWDGKVYGMILLISTCNMRFLFTCSDIPFVNEFESTKNIQKETCTKCHMPTQYDNSGSAVEKHLYTRCWFQQLFIFYTPEN